MRVRAELAVVVVRRRDDHQLLDAPLQEASGVDGAAEARKGTQDLGPQAHRLDHLDGRLTALPQPAAFVERGVVLDGLEGGLDLGGCDGHAHRRFLLGTSGAD